MSVCLYLNFVNRWAIMGLLFTFTFKTKFKTEGLTYYTPYPLKASRCEAASI